MYQLWKYNWVLWIHMGQKFHPKSTAFHPKSTAKLFICFGFWSKSLIKTEKCDRRGWKSRVFGDLARIHVPSQYSHKNVRGAVVLKTSFAICCCFNLFHILQSNYIVTRYYEVLFFSQSKASHLQRCTSIATTSVMPLNLDQVPSFTRCTRAYQSMFSFKRTM